MEWILPTAIAFLAASPILLGVWLLLDVYYRLQANRILQGVQKASTDECLDYLLRQQKGGR